MKHLIIASLASLAASTPCPYGQLAEQGSLSKEDTAKFFAARSEGESAVQSMIKKRQVAEHARQEHYYKRQLSLGDLPLGGGLLAGVLQPFSGVLSALDVPT